MNPWSLVAPDPASAGLYLSNGYLGTILGASLIPFGPEAAPWYIRGVYNDLGTGGIDRLARVPNWNQLRYVTPSTSSPLCGYRRELDLRHGCVRTSFTLHEQRGSVTVNETLFASRADPHRAASRINIECDFDGEIELYSSLEAHPEDVELIDCGVRQQTTWMHVRTRKYGVDVATVVAIAEDAWRIADTIEPHGVMRRLSVEVKVGKAVTLTRVAQIATELEYSDPLAFAKGSVPTFDALYVDHARAWDQLWETDIEIDGDPETQQFVRAALYYLWSTVQGDDRWSIPPMGLSSNGYNGHIFWDAETWMYPSLLATHPSMARACLNYREHTVEAARERARSGGYEGARFPWEGGFTGQEMTPTWAEPRELQIHITADVPLAFWWYFLATGDMDWLRTHGFPIMVACASFWLSRVEYNEEENRYEIRDVQCADEYAVGVNNDAFTNAAVRLSLLATARAADLLGHPVDPAWRTVAEGMYIPYDKHTGRHLEYDGYDGQVTKQADVELLTYPLEYVTDREQAERDLDYYSRVIDPNGPAMSYSVYAVISAQLDRPDEAYRYLQRSYIPNTRPPFWSFSETPSNNEFFFCTGIGGALQSLLFGFTGLRYREGYFVLGPILPEKWSALRLRNLFIQGWRTDIEMVPGMLTLRRVRDDLQLEAEVTRRSAGAELRVRWENDVEAHLAVVIESADGMPRKLVRPAPDEAVSLPSDWGGGIRLRVTLNEEDVLDVLLRRLPHRPPAW